MNKDKYDQLKTMREIKNIIVPPECVHIWRLLPDKSLWYCVKCRKIEEFKLWEQGERMKPTKEPSKQHTEMCKEGTFGICDCWCHKKEPEKEVCSKTFFLIYIEKEDWFRCRLIVMFVEKNAVIQKEFLN